MKRPWLKVLLVLVLALAATAYLVWRRSPEQTVIRRADIILECLSKKVIETGTATEKAERFRALLHPDFAVQAPLPIPSGPVSPDAAAGYLLDLQQSVTSCRISRSDERVTFPSDGKAVYEVALEVDILIAQNTQRLLRYRCQLEFVKEGHDWLLLRVVISAI